MIIKNKSLELEINKLNEKKLLDFILENINENVIRWAIVDAKQGKIIIEMSILENG